MDSLCKREKSSCPLLAIFAQRTISASCLCQKQFDTLKLFRKACFLMHRFLLEYMGDPYATAPGTDYGPYSGPPMPNEVIYPDHTSWSIGVNGEKPYFANTPNGLENVADICCAAAQISSSEALWTRILCTHCLAKCHRAIVFTTKTWPPRIEPVTHCSS